MSLSPPWHRQTEHTLAGSRLVRPFIILSLPPSFLSSSSIRVDSSVRASLSLSLSLSFSSSLPNSFSPSLSSLTHSPCISSLGIRILHSNRHRRPMLMLKPAPSITSNQSITPHPSNCHPTLLSIPACSQTTDTYLGNERIDGYTPAHTHTYEMLYTIRTPYYEYTAYHVNYLP
ncbi:hypothetical protein LX32DRAFT_223658 [Colletotrichum zoysiae]|uniref:Uncharacterized protein n=1 Tax=Colletotrichum zoysiae TaxID=1216348 RepID=A0AAD9H3X2_9PEZI|nr:hypothetical protein LX32DRAFT_223658 [Colletotrichum zoysiae]